LKKVNVEVILKLMVILGFFVFYFVLLKDNTITSYVHPRIIPYAKISLVLMGIIILFLVFNIFKDKMVKRSLKNYVIFLIPLIIFVSVGNSNFNSASKLQGGEASALTEEKTKDDSLEVDNEKPKEKENSEEENKKEKIVINDKQYVAYLDKIGNNHKEYVGREIEVTGFIYKDQTMKDKEFALARYMMTCCAADMQMVGYLCHFKEPVNLPNETWVKVNGKIEEDNDDVVIHVDNIEKIEAPKEGYVYPY